MPDSAISARSLKIVVPLILVLTGLSLIALGFDSASLREKLDNGGSLAPILFVGCGVILMSMMVPKTVVSVTAGALFGTLLGSGLMLLAAVSAAALNYAIGRWLLADWIQRRAVRSDPSGEILAIAHDMADDAGFGFHFLIRMTPVPTMLISYTMGACGARVLPYLAAAAVAVVPQMLWVHSGTAASLIDDPNSDGLRWIGLAVAVCAGVIVGVAVPREAMRRMKLRRQTACIATD